MKGKFEILLSNRTISVALGLWLILLVLVALQGNWHLADSVEFLKKAGCIWHGCENDLSIEELTKRPFLYPLVLSVFGEVGTIVLQNAILLFVLFLLLKRIAFNSKKSLLFALSIVITVLFSFNIFIYANKIMAEILAMFLLWIAFEALERSKVGWFLACIILLPFVKPVFLFLSIVLFGVFMLRKSWRKTSLLVGLMLSFGVSMLYSAFNLQRTGVFEFSSIQHINALQYNKHQFDVNRFGADEAKIIQQRIIAAGEEFTYSQKVKLYNGALLNDIKTHPLQYSFFHIKGAVRGILDPGRFDLQTIFPAISNEGFLHRKGEGIWAYLKSLNALTILLLLPLTLFNLFRFGLAVFGFVKSDKTIANVFAALCILYIIAISGPINASRFMVPIVPFLLLFSLDGVNLLFQRKITNAS